jgi:hypothetical protein
MCGNEVAGAVVEPEHLVGCTPFTLPHFLDDWKQVLPWREAGSRLIDRAWDLIEQNGEALMADFQHFELQTPETVRPLALGVVGPAERLWIDPTARLDPQVVADTTAGPVIVDRNAFIAPFSRLEGPCYIGPGSQVLGGKIRAGSTIGPYCRVGGEVEASILHGFPTNTTTASAIAAWAMGAWHPAHTATSGNYMPKSWYRGRHAVPTGCGEGGQLHWRPHENWSGLPAKHRHEHRRCQRIAGWQATAASRSVVPVTHGIVTEHGDMEASSPPLRCQCVAVVRLTKRTGNSIVHSNRPKPNARFYVHRNSVGCLA